MKNYLLPLFITFLGFFSDISAQKIYYFKIEGEINEATKIMADSAFAQAQRAKSDYIIIEINTFGGKLDAADAINQKILDYPKPVWAFINNNAYSAGALIAIACDSIYMADGSNIGAVTPINGATGEYASEKIRSAVRGKMRATAEKNRRNPLIAEAMVDENHENDSIATPGKLLVYTPQEAIKNGYCEGKFNSLEEVLGHYKLNKVQIQKYEPTFIEKVITFFANPVVSGILVLLIIGGIYFELQAPGIGLPSAVAVLALVAYFVPYYVKGLAENWELLLFVLGVALVAIEIFFFPGIKVALIGGLVIMFASLGLMMLSNVGFSLEGISQKSLLSALIVVSIGLFGSFGLIALLAPKLATSKKFSQVALQTTLDAKEGYTIAQIEKMIGKQGKSHTVLRPSGKVWIDGHLYDASTQGDFVEKDELIEVIAQEANELIIKKIS